MTSEVLYGINEWILFVLTVGILYGGAEVGFRYGERFAGRTRSWRTTSSTS
jgi:hypothetical protein